MAALDAECSTAATGQHDLITVVVQQIGGTFETQLRVSLRASIQDLRALVKSTMSVSVSEFRLLIDSLVLVGSGTLLDHGISDGAQITLVKVHTDTLVMYCGTSSIWSHTLPCVRKVTQMVVGWYSAYILLDDGTCWKVGPPNADAYDKPLETPEFLDDLRKVCGPVTSLGIDYMTLVAMTGQEVWLRDDSMCFGAVRFALCDGHADNTGDDIIMHANRLSGREVTNVAGDQAWGVVHTDAGNVLLYAVGRHSFDDSSDAFAECIQPVFAEQGEGLLIDVVGQAKAKKVAMTTHMTGAGIVLADGHVAVLPCDGCCMQSGALKVPATSGLEDIVDITANAEVFLDKHGHLWSIGSRIVVADDSRISKLCGNVAVSFTDGGERAYALGMHAAVPWGSDLEALGHAQAGRWFQMAYLSGMPPQTSLEDATSAANEWSEKEALSLAQQPATWQCLDNEGTWIDFASKVSVLLEAAHSRQDSVFFSATHGLAGTQRYRIDWSSMEQVNVLTKKRRAIRRVLSSNGSSI